MSTKNIESKTLSPEDFEKIHKTLSRIRVKTILHPFKGKEIPITRIYFNIKGEKINDLPFIRRGEERTLGFVDLDSQEMIWRPMIEHKPVKIYIIGRRLLYTKIMGDYEFKDIIEEVSSFPDLYNQFGKG